MSDIMEIIDERERQKNKYRKKQRSVASYSESVRDKWFYYTFMLGFVQLIYKASLIFKSNLELLLSIISKKENYMIQNMLWWSVDMVAQMVQNSVFLTTDVQSYSIYIQSYLIHIQSYLIYIQSYLTYIQSHLICIQSHLICIQSHLIYIQSSHLYSVILHLHSVSTYIQSS